MATATTINYEKTITTLWYIWKARNDFCFNNKKKWTVWQIHNSVAAEINISSSSLQVQDYITGNDHEIS